VDFARSRDHDRSGAEVNALSREFAAELGLQQRPLVAQPTPHQLQPRTSRIKTAVPISEITIEPMQPRRFEKNANTSFYFEPGSPID
jgi:hypothetical protein